MGSMHFDDSAFPLAVVTFEGSVDDRQRAKQADWMKKNDSLSAKGAA